MKKRGSIVFSLIFFLFLINFISAIPSNGLVAYYPFDGNSNDASGNGNNGIIYGNPQFVSGKIGSALNFDGVDDRINVVNNPIKSNSNFSASFWFNGVNQNSKYIFGGSILAYVGSSKLRFYPGQGAWSAYTTSAVTDNSWHYIAITHENQNTKIFVDGVQQVDSMTGNIFTSSNLEVGSRYNISLINGLLDDLAFYNRALTLSEIQQIYSEGSGNTCTPSCSGKQCGSDGCGGNCPPGCSSGYSCSNGNCILTQNCIDNDGDGYGANCALGNDCNDNNADINPGKTEICGNGIDEDCSGSDLVCNNQTTATGIIFEDNFDGYADWSSSTSYRQTETAAVTKNLIFGGKRGIGMKGWDSYRSSNEAHTLGNPLFQIDSINARSGKSLKCWYESNVAVQGGGVNLWFGGDRGVARAEQEKTGYNEVYIRMALKFDPIWTGDSGMFLKLFRVYTNKAPDWGDDLSTEWNYDSTLGNCQWAYPVLARRGTGEYPIGWSSAYIDIPNVSGKGCLGTGFPAGVNQGATASGGKDITPFMSDWIILQVYEKLNTPGQSDGIFKVWVNNNDPYNPDQIVTGLKIRDSFDRKWNTLIALDNLQQVTTPSKIEQYLAMDDLVISTSFIDNNYVIGNGTYLNQTIICIDNDHDGYNRSASGCGYRDCNDLDFSNFNVCNPGDTDSNGCVSQTELFAYMDRFYLSSKDVPLKKLGEAIELSYVC